MMQKLQSEEVRLLRILAKTYKYSCDDLGKMFGVSKSYASNIITGKVYKKLLKADKRTVEECLKTLEEKEKRGEI